MKKQFLVALHVHSKEQVLSEVSKILTPLGAHGVLLVNNGLRILSKVNEYPNLFDVAIIVKEHYPSYIVGVNPLDLDTHEAVETIFEMQADYADVSKNKKLFDVLWTDDGGVCEEKDKVFLPSDLNVRGLRHLGIEYYGGVAFKYQVQPKNLEGVVSEAAKHFSAVITSGNATGSPADIRKVQYIKSSISGAVSLGIASGLTAENVNTYVEYADIFIVGTSLLVDPGDDSKYSKEKIERFRAVLDSL